jgi:hypothetical protein
MTNSLKYGIASFAIILLLFLFNQRSQRSYNITGVEIFDGNEDEISRIKITEKNKSIELLKTDTTWSILGNDSLIIIENKIKNIFDKVLKTKKEMLITSKNEKWSKFGVDDSTGKHFILHDVNDNELLHLIFGNKGQDFQHNYVRNEKSSDVYRTNSNIFFMLNTTPTYWGNLPKTEEKLKEE